MQLETIIISEASQKEKDKYRMIALICEISNESIYETEGFPWSLSWKWIRLTWRRPQPNSWVRKIPWRRGRLLTPVFMGFPGGSDGKESACNAGDLGSIPGLGRSPGRRHGKLPQYSCLQNPHGQRSLAVHSPRGCRESDVTEWWSTHDTEIESQTQRTD